MIHKGENVFKFNRIHFSAFILILAMLACQTSPSGNVQPQPTLDLDAAIAATANAARTLTALVSTPVPSLAPSQTFTATTIPSETPTATLAFTATPEIPMISVSVSTNCRNGPGKIYDYQGALSVGKTVEVLAGEPTGKYWYIQNPEPELDGDQFCWVWGEYATITGDVSILPIYTPPPTPTATSTPNYTMTALSPTSKPANTASPASFVVGFSGLDTCSSAWWVDVKVRNNGTVTFTSMSIVIKDMFNNTTFDIKSNGFTDRNGCGSDGFSNDLDPGDIIFISGPEFSYDPTGHNLKVTLTMCTNSGQKGTCAKQNFDINL
jgi:hypothetical protein